MYLLLALAIALPTTTVGKKLDAWLQALNAGDRAKLRALDGNDESAARSAAGAATFAWMTGGIDVEKIERSTDTDISVHAHARLTDARFPLAVHVGAQPPHAIDWRAHPAESPIPETEKLAPAEIARRLDAFVDKLAQPGRSSGAIMVVKDGKVLLEKAFGLASRAWNAPNRIDTKFNLGSMNKMFTAVAIAQLYENGKLKLDDKVGHFLPDFANADVRDKVTVRQLLSHTSGLADYFGPKFEEKKLHIREVRDYLPLIAG